MRKGDRTWPQLPLGMCFSFFFFLERVGVHDQYFLEGTRLIHSTYLFSIQIRNLIWKYRIRNLTPYLPIEMPFHFNTYLS